MNAELQTPIPAGRHFWGFWDFWVCWMLTLLAMEAGATDLLDVYRQAGSGDPAYRSAAHALQAARERVPQAKALLLPAIGLSGNNGRQSGRTSFNGAPEIDRQVNSNSWNLQLTQPLWRVNSWLALDQAQLQEVLAEEQFHQAEQDLILRAAQAYLDVLVAQQAGQVAQRQVSAVDQQLTLARRNFDVGTGTVTDVHEARSRLDLSRAQEVVARSDLDNKRAELRRLTGTPAGALSALRDSSGLPAIEARPADSWEDSAREQSIPVRIAQASLRVAAAEIDRSRAAHSPSLDFTASHGSNFSSGSISSPADISTRYRATQVGLSLNVPLYAGGGIAARVREAIALKDKAGEDLEAARRLAATQAGQAYTGVVNGRAQVDALASAIQSSRAAVDANKIGFAIGTRINIDVLNAEQQLYAAQRDWHKARADTLMQGLRLKASNATLDEGDLNVINNLLEVPTHE